jgi:hypothetical protein
VAKILLVEPSRILSQAIRLFLFPEHEVRVAERIERSEVSSLEEGDLLILDSAELRRRGWWSAELERAIQQSGVPVLWLEGDDAVQSPARERQAVLRKPIQRKEFQEAIASLRPGPASEKKQTRSSTASEEKAPATRNPPGAESSRGQEGEEGSQFIDLVDAVEEEVSPEQSKSLTGKPK